MWSSSIRRGTSTTRPPCSRSTSSNRCSARARWCAGRCGRASTRVRLPQHAQTEARHPAAADLELRRHLVGVLPGALPAAAHVHRLTLIDVAGGRKHQCRALERRRAAQEPAATLDVEVLELRGGGVPQIDRLAELVRAALGAVHDVLVTQELAAVDAAEAVFVRPSALGKGAFPAVT